MPSPTETSRTPPDFWLLVAEEDGRVLTVGAERAPAVFSGEGEAELVRRLGGGGDGRRIVRASPRELASLLVGPSCAGATRVVLDPSPEMLSDDLLVELVSVGKDRFLERFAGRPEEEAETLLRLGGDGGGRRARERRAGKPASVLPGPYKGVGRVALDPMSGKLADTVGLAGLLSREGSLEGTTRRGGSPAPPQGG